MMRRLELGQWVPDVAPLMVQRDLTVCKNVVPVAGGYAPFASLSNIDANAVSLAPNGSLRATLPDGTNQFYVGTASTIERLGDAGWYDLSRIAGYTPVTQSRWSATQFGTAIFFTNRADALQVYDTASSLIFSDVPTAPRFGVIATAENFLVGGDFIDGSGVVRDGVAWSGINDGTNWPDPLSDDATAVQSGRAQLEGDGGIVNGIVSGAEVLAVFQQNAIHRGDYVGSDIVWRFQRVETEHGLLVREAAVAYERRVFFISRDGFRVFNYTSSQNIGKERVNDFFFSDWDSSYPQSLSMKKDPNATRIYVSYAATDATDGIPNRILVWDFALDQFSVLYPGGHYDLIEAGTVALSLDSPDTAEDPDRIGGASDDEDPPGDESFDDTVLSATNVQIGAFDSSFRMGTFSGANLSGVLETGDIELTPGRRSLLTAIRPLVDGEETNAQVASLARRGEDTTDLRYSLESEMDEDGECPVRIDARYHRIRLNLSPHFTEASGMEVDFRPTGTR